jgi:transposase
VWAPDPAHEAVRDLARAREAAADDLRRKRQQLLSFLLRHSRIYSGGGHWTLAHRRRLAGQTFDHAAQQIVFQEGIDAIEDSLQRLRRLEKQLALVAPEWSMAPMVAAYQAMRGASFLVAVTFAAEIGDVRRFDTPRQLTSFLGLVPAESSTGIPSDGWVSLWRATGARGGRSSRRPGPIAIQRGSLRSRLCAALAYSCRRLSHRSGARWRPTPLTANIRD